MTVEKVLERQMAVRKRDAELMDSCTAVIPWT